MFVCAEACPLCAITQSPPRKSSFKKQMGEEVRARQARGGRVEGSIKKRALLPLWQSGQEDSLFHSSPVPPSLRWESSLLWHCFSSKATFDLHLGDIYLQWTSKAAERQSRTCQGLSLRRDSWNKSVPVAWETRPRPQGILSGMDAARLSCRCSARSQTFCLFFLTARNSHLRRREQCSQPPLCCVWWRELGAGARAHINSCRLSPLCFGTSQAPLCNCLMKHPRPVCQHKLHS